MGSDDKAVITGFICRLCSKMNRFVVHIYGDEGIQMQLAQKINIYLPITVNPNDPLPKTICIQCIDSLEAQHELMEQFKWARQRVQRVKKGEHTMEGCSPRPPNEIRGQSMTSFLLRPSDTNRSPRGLRDGSTQNTTSRPSSDSPNTSSSTDISLNPSISQIP